MTNTIVCAAFNNCYRLEILLWSATRKRIVRNATAPMNHVQGKVFAASVSRIIYDYGICQHAVSLMMQRRPLIGPLNISPDWFKRKKFDFT